MQHNHLLSCLVFMIVVSLSVCAKGKQQELRRQHRFRRLPSHRDLQGLGSHTGGMRMHFM